MTDGLSVFESQHHHTPRQREEARRRLRLCVVVRVLVRGYITTLAVVQVVPHSGYRNREKEVDPTI